MAASPGGMQMGIATDPSTWGPLEVHMVAPNHGEHRFRNGDKTIKVGETVTWINDDFGMAHNVFSGTWGQPDGKFQSWPVMSTGDIFRFTFTQPGTYPFFCSFHPEMKGVITVQ